SPAESAPQPRGPRPLCPDVAMYGRAQIRPTHVKVRVAARHETPQQQPADHVGQEKKNPENNDCLRYRGQASALSGKLPCSVAAYCRYGKATRTHTRCADYSEP